MEPNEDTWERDDWDLAGAAQLEREEVLRLARHLAGQRERLRDEELAEFADLKRELRERAVAAERERLAAELATVDEARAREAQEREELERLHAEAARTSDELAARAATAEAEEQELVSERDQLGARLRELDERDRELA